MTRKIAYNSNYNKVAVQCLDDHESIRDCASDQVPCFEIRLFAKILTVMGNDKEK